jgi:tRNA 2-thiocytidine biosynthesis protein TtcA
MLREWEKAYPGRTETMFTALHNLVPSHLMDAALHNFKDIKITGIADADGDKVFDAQALPLAPLPNLRALAL